MYTQRTLYRPIQALGMQPQSLWVHMRVSPVDLEALDFWLSPIPSTFKCFLLPLLWGSLTSKGRKSFQLGLNVLCIMPGCEFLCFFPPSSWRRKLFWWWLRNKLLWIQQNVMKNHFIATCCCFLFLCSSLIQYNSQFPLSLLLPDLCPTSRLPQIHIIPPLLS